MVQVALRDTLPLLSGVGGSRLIEAIVNVIRPAFSTWSVTIVFCGLRKMPEVGDNWPAELLNVTFTWS
ncbi:hypothetical protein FQZ97_1032910 [compost metagenome]